MPKIPCPECSSMGRHRKTCSKYRANVKRQPNEEVALALFMDRLPTMHDDVLTGYLFACTNEARTRRERILQEATERVKRLEAALPQVKPLAPAVLTETPPTRRLPEPAEETREAAPAPQEPRPIQRGGKRRICAHRYPENREVICTQWILGGAETHDGDHYNHASKRAWPQVAARKFPPKAVPTV